MEGQYSWVNDRSPSIPAILEAEAVHRSIFAPRLWEVAPLFVISCVREFREPPNFVIGPALEGATLVLL